MKQTRQVYSIQGRDRDTERERDKNRQSETNRKTDREMLFMLKSKTLVNQIDFLFLLTCPSKKFLTALNYISVYTWHHA